MSSENPAIHKFEPALAAAVLVVLTALFLIPSIRGVDGTGNYVYLMSILKDQDLDFTNEYAAFDADRNTPYRLSDAIRHAETDLPANRYGIGSALFWAPAVTLVHLLLSLTSPQLATGMTRPYEWAVGLSSAFWGCLGLWYLYLRFRERFDRAVSAATILALIFATPMLFYLWMNGSTSHPVGFFIAVAALLTLEKFWLKPTTAKALIVGFWASMLVVTRFQDVTWAVALGVAVLAGGARNHAIERPPGSEASPKFDIEMGLRFLPFFALGAALAALPQMAVWKVLYGSWVSGPLPYLDQGGGRLGFFPVHIFGALLSERGGFLAWHPVLLVAIFGLWKGRAFFTSNFLRLVILGLALQIYLVASWSMWWAGASFGNRFFISSYPYFAFGLVYFLESLRNSGHLRRGFALLAVLVAWNLGLLIQYGTEMISREKQEGWALVVKQQFVDVPVWIGSKITGGSD